jgi:hypothetical protein
VSTPFDVLCIALFRALFKKPAQIALITQCALTRAAQIATPTPVVHLRHQRDLRDLRRPL